MANVSLDKDLFYQYMINNNSTSTMLNALSGNTNTGVQSANDLSGVLGALPNPMWAANRTAIYQKTNCRFLSC